MFTVNIDGMIVLYTGDYSRIPDRHLPGADLPNIQPNIGSFEFNLCMNCVVLFSDCGEYLWSVKSLAETAKGVEFLKES